MVTHMDSADPGEEVLRHVIWLAFKSIVWFVTFSPHWSRVCMVQMIHKECGI